MSSIVLCGSVASLPVATSATWGYKGVTACQDIGFKATVVLCVYADGLARPCRLEVGWDCPSSQSPWLRVLLHATSDTEVVTSAFSYRVLLKGIVDKVCGRGTQLDGGLPQLSSCASWQ